MIKTILIIAGVIVGAPIALFVLFVVAVIINFLIQPEMNSSGMIIECRGCPGMKNGSDKWPCNECEFRPDNRWWDPELECEILKTSRRYKKVQKKRAKERIILPPDFEIRVAKNKNLQIAYEVISGSWGNGADRKNRLSAAGYNYEEIQTIVNEICVPKKKSVCGGMVILKRKGAALRSAGFYQGPDTTASWECITCGTEFDADFNYTSAGNIEARNREAYIERHTEGVPIAGEVWPKIW